MNIFGNKVRDKAGIENLMNILEKKNDVDTIQAKRNIIGHLIMQNSPNITGACIAKMTADDLKLLFQLYDDVFFDNQISSFDGTFKFSLSSRMTRSAGMTICPKNITKMKDKDIVIEIRIGIDFFLHYDQLEGDKLVGGCITNSQIEALQLVFEHELCHAVEFILFHKSSCKGKRFKSIASNLFGHTESNHQLPTYRNIAEQKLNLNIGDGVRFDYDGRHLEGLLYKINKRAVVMVKDRKGTMADRHGNRYAKYYVPLERLVVIK